MKGQTNYIMISNNMGETALHVAADVGSIKVSLIAQETYFRIPFNRKVLAGTELILHQDIICDKINPSNYIRFIF